MTTKQPSPIPTSARTYVRFHDSHSMAGKLGYVFKSVQPIQKDGALYVKVHLLDGESVYASPSQIEQVHPTSPPAPKRKGV